MAAKKEDKNAEISILDLTTREVQCRLIGTSPIIFNAVSEKARHELLFPRGRLTAADKQANMKHDPVAEFRRSVYRRAGNGPTRLIFPAPGIKKAICTAALDLPGSVTKAKIGRLAWVKGESLNIFGIPELHMSVVRMADVSRTPDIRTRAILREWAFEVTVCFVEPMLKSTGIATLLAAGGLICGIGDYRQEKGAGSFGQFKHVTEDYEKKDYERICREGCMKAQDAALNADPPHCYNEESESLLSWYMEEVKRRGAETKPVKRGRKTNGDDATAPA